MCGCWCREPAMTPRLTGPAVLAQRPQGPARTGDRRLRRCQAEAGRARLVVMAAHIRKEAPMTEADSRTLSARILPPPTLAGPLPR